jgi:hypothetical protein
MKILETIITFFLVVPSTIIEHACDADMVMHWVMQRSNIIYTITTPSESLLKELQTVEVRSTEFIFKFARFNMHILISCLLPSLC